jgi:hypothetical protein
MTMNKYQFFFPHFPSLLNNLAESPVEDDISRMVAVKINLHLLPLAWFWGGVTTVHRSEKDRFTAFGSHEVPLATQDSLRILPIFSR